MRIAIWRHPGTAMLALAALAVLQLTNPSAVLAQDGKPGEASKIAGTWRGESRCLDKDGACHDEVAVYRIATIAGKPDALLVSGGKMVDGKEIVLGTGEWAYDRAKDTMKFELPMGTITLKLEGETLRGTYLLHDKSVLRRINLKKSE